MQSLLHENKHTLKLAFPIIISHLGQMLLGLSDTVMIGRLGTVELAAVAFVNVVTHLIMVVGIGWAVGVSIQVSHAHGAHDHQGKRNALVHGVTFSLLSGLLIGGGMAMSMPLLGKMGQAPEVMTAVPPYLYWIAPSMGVMMPVMVLKSYAEAVNRPWGVFAIQFAGVLVNIGLNALLIFGLYGLPRMGIAGAGLATFVSRLLTLAVMAGYLGWRFPDATPKGTRLQLREYLTLLKMATPISAQMLMEFGAFAASAVLIGQLGALPLAAHQIAITCAATTYMIPLGLSNAVGIRVGHALGASAHTRCRQILWGAQGLTILVMGSFAVIYLTLGTHIAEAFTADQDLIALAVPLLSIAGIFQLFDGIQVVSMGALRAMKDVALPTLFSFIGYWIIACPLGFWLGFRLEQGVSGFWTGLACGLAFTAIIMTSRLIWLLRQYKFSNPQTKTS